VKLVHIGYRSALQLLTTPVTSRKHHVFDGRVSHMTIRDSARSAAAIHRKLRGLAAVFSDPAATEHEKANAERLKARLEKQLPQEPTPTEAAPTETAPSEPTPGAAWTNIMFRLGRGVREMKSPPPSPKRDWTDHAFRLGRMLRRGLKR
jgi:hypothetical protein